jgi:uncharacterized protein YcnI
VVDRCANTDWKGVNQMKKLVVSAVAAIAATLAVAAAAQAHVTVHPNALPAGGFQVINIRIPNEEDKASTTKLVVQFPPGFPDASWQPVGGGWKASISFRKLAKPVIVEGEKLTEEVNTVTFTGGKLAPGQFMQFPLSVATPSKPGAVLTFKAVQTYSNGDVVRWIGAPGTDTPAPQVLLTSKDSAIQDFPGGVTAAKKARASGHKTLYGFVVAVPLLALTGLGVARRRRMS